jgi:hypothetical protein
LITEFNNNKPKSCFSSFWARPFDFGGGFEERQLTFAVTDTDNYFFDIAFLFHLPLFLNVLVTFCWGGESVVFLDESCLLKLTAFS